LNNKVIFFSIDRLGDYLIRSNIINQISKIYSNREIVCSKINYKLISKQTFFDKIYILNNNSNKDKFVFLKNFLFKRYDSIIVFDGKTISNILIFLIKAKFKYIFIYKKKGFINKISLFLFKNLLKLFKIKFSILNSKAIIEKGELDNYPKKYKELRNYFNISNKTYYLEGMNSNKKLNFKDKYVLIHLDEKFNDILDINTNFNECLKKFSMKTKHSIILSSFNNNNEYYKKLEFDKISSSDLFKFEKLDKKIFIVEELPLENFFTLIKESYINISCHAGFMIHTSLFLNKNCIDIINFSDENWIKTWITETSNYKRIYKSNLYNKYNAEKIFNNIIELDNEI